MTLRVLHVLDKLSIDSGVSVMVLNYFKKLDHQRLTFDFMVNEEVAPQLRAFIEGFGSQIFVMPSLKAKNTLAYISALRDFYKKNPYEVIHGHVANSAVFYLGLAGHIPNRILHSHSSSLSDVQWKKWRNWFLTRSVKKVANHYMACSIEAAEILFGPNEQITIMENAIDAAKFRFNVSDRTQLRASLKIGDERLIGHVGRFSAVKNHRFILSVFNEVYRLNRNFKLLLIGEGELKSEIEKSVQELGLSDVISIIGITDEVEKYMSAMDVLILPSLFEGLGIAGVEAQASGLPVLVSESVPKAMDITGNVKYIPLDVDEWVSQLLSLELNLNRIYAGEKVLGSRYDLKYQMDELYNYYENLISNHV